MTKSGGLWVTYFRLWLILILGNDVFFPSRFLEMTFLENDVFTLISVVLSHPVLIGNVIFGK